MRENLIGNFIDDKLSEIAKHLPELVHTKPDSFACGHTMGYKQALLDLQRLLDDNLNISFYHCDICAEEIDNCIECPACGNVKRGLI